MPTYCEKCHRPCKVSMVDFGIGYYEFQGRRGVDSRCAVVSDCCESEYWNDEDEMLTDLTEEVAERISRRDDLTLEQIEAINAILDGKMKKPVQSEKTA